MLSRILPREEYHRLAVTGFPAFERALAPEDIRVLVTEEDGEIVSTLTAMRVVQFERMWINPKYRGNPSAVAVWSLAVACAKAWGVRWVAALCATAIMRKHIKRLGGSFVRAEWFTIPIGD